MRSLFAALFSLALIGGPAAAGVPDIINGSFEIGAPKKGWKVFQTIPGWTTIDGNGIEIQTDGVKGVTTPFGNAWVELDSHPRDGNSNSTMSQSLLFDIGTYELSYWYRPRTNKGRDDNGIFVNLFDGINSIELDRVSETLNTQNDWEQRLIMFDIDIAGSYDLQVGAFGKENTLGGFVDNFDIKQVSEPSMLLLMALGLLSVTFLRRRSSV